MSIISIQHLQKIYKGSVTALGDVSLDIAKGEFLGLLGPNGAGKSTLIGILCGLVNKTKGQVCIDGYDLDKQPYQCRLSLGVVPQEFNFNIFEPCLQVILNQAGYYGVSRSVALKYAEVLLQELDLWQKRDTPAGRLSGGMKRRLMIARALIHKPKILILDEPTAGVDISLRRTMWTFLQALNQTQKTTIILTTHYLEEAESLCNRIAIINQGGVIANLPTADLLSQLSSETLIVTLKHPVNALDLESFRCVKIDDMTYEIDLHQGQSVTDLIHGLSARNIEVDRMRNKANRLEELFVKLVGDH